MGLEWGLRKLTERYSRDTKNSIWQVLGIHKI